jgi:hypothetical protein
LAERWKAAHALLPAGLEGKARPTIADFDEPRIIVRMCEFLCLPQLYLSLFSLSTGTHQKENEKKMMQAPFTTT